VTVSDQSGPAIGDIVVRREEDSQRHGMTLLAIDYVATDNCSGVSTALFASGRDDDRVEVVDAHHVLVKGGHSRGGDDDDRHQVRLTIVATDEIGNQSERSVTIGGRSKDR